MTRRSLTVLTRAARGLCRDLSDFFYPPACVLCGRPPAEGAPVCTACGQALGRLPQPVCPHCRLFVAPQATGCASGHRPAPFPVWALGLFDPCYRRLIHAFKFQDRRDCGDYLGALLAQCLPADRHDADFDLVTAVPLHGTRLRERGFNQSAVLARGIGARVGLPVHGQLLRRVRNTRSQTELGFRERQKNVAGAFRAAEADIEGRHVLLVDDVLTTGATLHACAEVLVERGARRVSGAVVALADPTA